MASSSSSGPQSHNSSMADFTLVDPTVPNLNISDVLAGTRLVIQKKLCTTDIARRIVLFKDEAEKNLPPIGENESMRIKVYDIKTLDIWYFTYRCYADSKKRKSYFLENAGDYVRRHRLRTNDIIKIYRDDKDYLLIRSEKVRVPKQMGSRRYRRDYKLITADFMAQRPRPSELFSSWIDDNTNSSGNINPAFLHEMMPLPSPDEPSNPVHDEF